MEVSFYTYHFIIFAFVEIILCIHDEINDPIHKRTKSYVFLLLDFKTMQTLTLFIIGFWRFDQT